MKFLNQNKFLIAVAVAAVLAFFCFRFFMQALKADHSLDVYKLESRLQEEKRQEIIKTRVAYQLIITDQDKKIMALQLRDSVLAVHAGAIQQKIKTIESPIYVKEKLQPVADYTPADLQQYFNELKPMPEPTDY